MPKFPYVIHSYVREDGETGGEKWEVSPVFTVYARDPEQAVLTASRLRPELELGAGHSTWFRYWRGRARGLPCLNPPERGDEL